MPGHFSMLHLLSWIEKRQILRNQILLIINFIQSYHLKHNSLSAIWGLDILNLFYVNLRKRSRLRILKFIHRSIIRFTL